MPHSTLSRPLFAILTALVEERTGMHYEPHDLEMFASKLVARAIDAGFESPLDYYYFLRYDDPDRREFDALTESLVVNETYFYREAPSLRVLCDDILRPIVTTGRRARVWCAACSTGEEPLTLAMLLAERSLLEEVEIVASDISERALARAREGTYGQRSLRAVADVSKERWLERVGDGCTVRPEIRKSVAWRRVNLLERDTVGAMGGFDAIVCRNVLIYFSETTIRQVVSSLTEALREDGCLLVGASESLLRFGTMLLCEERGGSFLYRKPRS
jgi:chemotaxis protein methyltransferase CheR